jgi:hypothetical protein
MDVVFDTANLKCDHFVFSRNASDVLPNSIFDVGEDPRLTVLGAEGEVIVERRVGVGHGSASVFQSSLRDDERFI